MTTVSERSPRSRSRAILAAALLVALPSAAFSADAVEVVLDQAKLIKLPDRVATIVVGNPLIADVTIQVGGMMVLTGKGYGLTNIIALDRSGAVLMDRAVQVLGPQEKVVVVYRGVNRESYSCAPTCERRITLGDTPEFFQQAIAQTGTRNQSAQSSGQQQTAR
jgi:Flp pilus assembly secretin CpaC